MQSNSSLPIFFFKVRILMMPITFLPKGQKFALSFCPFGKNYPTYPFHKSIYIIPNDCFKRSIILVKE